MRRTDRLFGLMTLLRDGRLHRASDLADRLEVSQRTIYRDVETLRASGVPVEGARGVGYTMTEPVSLPPLTLSLTELEALQLGIAVVGEAADRELAQAAGRLSAKIDAALPGEAGPPASRREFAVHPLVGSVQGYRHLPAIRAATRARQKLRLLYRRTSGDAVWRVIRPLNLDFRGRLWTLAAWCELREDFRLFRVDRIEMLSTLPELFVDEPERTLDDYLGVADD